MQSFRARLSARSFTATKRQREKTLDPTGARLPQRRRSGRASPLDTASAFLSRRRRRGRRGPLCMAVGGRGGGVGDSGGGCDEGYCRSTCLRYAGHGTTQRGAWTRPSTQKKRIAVRCTLSADRLSKTFFYSSSAEDTCFDTT